MRHVRLSVLSLSFFSAVLVAPPLSHALSAGEASCRDEIAGGIARYARTIAKQMVRCSAGRSTGDLPLDTDCNDASVAAGGTRHERAQSDLADAITGACAGAGSLLPGYGQCPSPAQSADDGGTTTGIDDFGELAACLAALADVHLAQLFSDVEGAPAQTIMGPLLSCEGSLGKGAGKLARTILSERRRCQHALDIAGGDSSYACDGSDPAGRIGKASTRYAEDVAGRCSLSSDLLAKLAACSDTASGLEDCSGSSADRHASDLVRLAYGFAGGSGATTTSTTLEPSACGGTYPACNGTCAEGSSCVAQGSSCTCVVDGTGPCAPATIFRTIHAHYGSVPSLTTLSTGWSGRAIDVDVPDDTGDAIDVTCDQNCENCNLDLHTATDNPASVCRCTSDSTKNCSVVNGSDPEHCGSVDPTCRCYFGAPLPLSSGGTPACVVSRIRQDYAGTMNLRTGEWHDQIRLASVVYLGISQTAPCPTCEGDIKPNDGVRDGTCTGGVSSNACDENGRHATFGPTSFDCMPASAANVSGTGLLISLNASTGPLSMPATLPCQTPGGALCPCRVCSGNGNLGCSSDADCAAEGAGSCTDGGGAGVNLNSCDNFECNSDGKCATGPVDHYCDGIVHPDGRGFISCTSDADCTPYSAGSCTVLDIRRCFPDPITTTGVADPREPSSAALFCIAPTSNAGINVTGGLPGPGKYVLSFHSDIRCQSDPTIPYEFPSGANCTSAGATTTTLLPLAPCESATAPVCGGVCPTGETCGASGSGGCVCTAPPIPLCADASSPVCGGRCTGTSEVCRDDGTGTCACVIPTLPQCADAATPLCGGVCPNGEVCQSVGDTCECGAPGAPVCGTAIAPACGGTCDVGSVCTASGNSCVCVSSGLPSCADASAPVCGGTCSLGSVCEQVGAVCQCVVIPIP